MTVLDFDSSIAVVIGIDRYGDGIEPLSTPVSDAIALAKMLKEEHHYDIVRVLLDEQATHKQLTVLISETLSTLLTERSRLLFYFAGHGIAQDNEDGEGPAGYLIPQDAKANAVHSYLPMTLLHDKLTALPCKHFLGILDCCFAGAFRWSSTRKIARKGKTLHQERFDRFQTDPAWQVITSASHDQEAWDVIALRDDRGSNEQHHSPFADALMTALRGAGDISPPGRGGEPAGDGVITASELSNYLRDIVEPLTAKGGRKPQTPEMCYLSQHDKGEYIFLTPDYELDLPSAPKLDESNNPYRGLKAFDQEHAGLFFGRDDEIEQLVRKVADPNPLTVVLGVSGTGKSSLVKAGLLPRLMKNSEYEVLPVMRPGDRPFEALAEAFAALGADGQDLGQLLAQDAQSLADMVKRWRQANPKRKLLLVVDQTEELVTQTRSQAEKEHFQRLVEAAMIQNPLHIRIVATLRLDFEAQFQGEALRTSWMSARYVVPPMTSAQLKEAIEKPASERVLYFEPSSLVARLIEDVGQTPGALPLLSFTLSELYLRYIERRSENRALTQEDYDALGGVIGSLKGRANHEYESLIEQDPVFENTMKQVMLRMIATEGGELARRRVPLSELSYADKDENIRVQVLLKNFVEARLIVQGKERRGTSYVEPAHDALVRSWGKLLYWRNKNQDSANVRYQALQAAKNWRQNEHNVNDLWTKNSSLPRLQELDSSGIHWLNSLEHEFTRKSIAQQKKNRRRAFFLAAFVIWSILVVSARILYSSQIANRERLVALAGQLASQSGNTLRQKGSYLPRSILLAIEAEKQFPLDSKAPKGEIDTALRRYTLLAPEVAKYEAGDAAKTDDVTVKEANFSPDGRWIATASTDKTVRLWAVENNRLYFEIALDHPARDVQFSEDSLLVAIATEGSTAEIWDIQKRQQAFTAPHQDVVTEVRFSPDGKYLATASKDKTVQLWALENRQPVSQLEHGASVIELSFSSDSKQLITAGKDGVAKIWDWQTQKVLQEINHKGPVWDARFSPNGETVATASRDGFAALWETKSGRLLFTFPHGAAVWDVRFHPDGEQLATSSGDSFLRIWDLNSGLQKHVLKHESIVRDVRWSHDGSQLVSASVDWTARLWDTATGEELLRMVHEHAVYDARFSPDSRQLLTNGENGAVRLWDATASKEIARFRVPFGLNNVRLSPDNTLLAASGVGDSVKVWNLQTEAPVYSLPHSQKGISEIQFSPSGRYLVSAGRGDNTVRLWDMQTGQPQLSYTHDDDVSNVSFSDDGQFIVSASKDKTARMWDINAQAEVLRVTHRDAVRDARLSFDNRLLATASDDTTARIWDVSTREEVTKIQHKDVVYEARFSPGGKKLLTASRDATSKLWDIDKDKEIKELKHKGRIWDVRFSPDGKTIATAGQDTTARLWSAKNGHLLDSLDHDERILEVSFSPDGKTIATVSADKFAQVWDVQSGQQLSRVASRYKITNAQLNDRGDQLAIVTFNGDATTGDVTMGDVTVHDVSAGTIVEKACQRLTRDLTDIEWRRYMGEGTAYRKTCSPD